MKLLHVDTLELEEFPSHGAGVQYAILSHKWLPPKNGSEQEVSMLDLQSNREEAQQKPGWKKIQYTIDQARKSGIQYVWIDTCCIKKDAAGNSDQESINLMFKWYTDAAICYTYLDDVDKENIAVGSDGSLVDLFLGTGWIKRGWTLQELIAPPTVIFFDRHWQYLTSRKESADAIAKVSGIDVQILRADTPLDDLYTYSVAKRMSWAAGRETTKPEDRVYSLFGLFDITMRTHYGEGERAAFARYQKKLVKHSADQSLFAWKRGVDDAQQGLLFAPSPDRFAGRGHIMSVPKPVPASFSLVNGNLIIDIEGYVSPTTDEQAVSAKGSRSLHGYKSYSAILDCKSDSTKYASIAFVLDLDSLGQGKYCISTKGCMDVPLQDLQKHHWLKRFHRSQVTIQENSQRKAAPSSYPMLRFDLKVDQSANSGMECVVETCPSEGWETSHYQPQSNSAFGVRIACELADRKEHINVAFAYSLQEPIEDHEELRVDVDDPAQPERQRLPVFLVDVDRDDTCSLADTCARTEAMPRDWEDPFLRYLPLTHTTWIDRRTRCQLRLDKADYLGERLWVAEAVISCVETDIPWYWYLCRKHCLRWAMFVLLGWDTNNVILDHGLSLYLRSNSLMWMKAMLLVLIFHFESARDALSTCVMLEGFHFIAINSPLWNRLFHARIAPAALSGAEPSFQKLLRISCGSGMLLRHWGLAYLTLFGISAYASGISGPEIFSTVLNVTISRDLWLLMTPRTGSTRLRIMRLLRLGASSLLRNLVGGHKIFGLSYCVCWLLAMGVLVLLNYAEHSDRAGRTPGDYLIMDRAAVFKEESKALRNKHLKVVTASIEKEIDALDNRLQRLIMQDDEALLWEHDQIFARSSESHDGNETKEIWRKLLTAISAKFHGETYSETSQCVEVDGFALERYRRKLLTCAVSTVLGKKRAELFNSVEVDENVLADAVVEQINTDAELERFKRKLVVVLLAALSGLGFM